MNAHVIPQLTLLPSTSINPPFRAFTKQHKILGYLKDYHCHLAKCADNSLSAIRGANHLYDVSNRVPACHKALSVAISFHTEQNTPSQAIKCLEWQAAMQADLKALESKTHDSDL